MITTKRTVSRIFDSSTIFHHGHRTRRISRNSRWNGHRLLVQQHMMTVKTNVIDGNTSTTMMNATDQTQTQTHVILPISKMTPAPLAMITNPHAH